MFLEHDLKSEFWHFVYARALDPRYELDERPESPVLDALEMHRTDILITSKGVSEVPECELVDQGKPRVYSTLQEALLAFLIHRVADGGFPFPHEVWLRTIILVMADVQRRPDYWLRVTATNYAEDHYRKPEEPRGHSREHVMTISDDWGCLYREVFDLVRQTYGRAEPSSP